MTTRFARAFPVALLVALGLTVPTPASASPHSPATTAAATTCYGGAVTVHYGDALEFGPYWASARCTDINMRVIGGTAEYVNACVKFAKYGTCNRWTKVGRSWTTIATDVLDGSKFTVPAGVPLEGDDAVMQIAF
ncbi:hypothetical protein [Streptomyces sp. NPDC057616]|uniref:hypothetical protein n=1 Tax=Streptomyces sp. NPDC057616 TaxID=3346183 RepID=UPI0036D03A14